MARTRGGHLDVHVWDALKGASWPIFTAIAERTRDAGLSPAQSSLMFILYSSKEPLTPLAVSRALGVTPGTVTGTLNPLDDAGLINRIRGATEDRRVVHLQITPKGRDVMSGWLNACRALIEERMGPLTVSEKRQLIELLAKIAPAQPGVPEGLASMLRMEAPKGDKRKGRKP